MNHFNSLNDLNHREYEINNHRKKIAALILAIIIYFFFTGPLIIDMVPQSWRRTPLREPLPSQQQQRRASPAPVKYVSPPQKSAPQEPVQAQSQPIIIPPLPQEIPDKSLEEPLTQPKLLPKKRTAQESSETEPLAKPSGHKEQKPLEQPEPKSEPIKIEPYGEPSQKKESRSEPLRDTPALKPRKQEDSAQEIPKNQRKERRSTRKKWFKEESRAAYASKDAHEYQKSAKNLASQLSQGLYEHMYKENYQKGAQSLEGALGIGDPAGDFEINIFNEKFNRNFCNDSEMNPLYLHTGVPIQPHSIIFEISYTKDRKVKKVTFLKESYDKRLNKYVQEICLRMPLPQFPSRWPEEEITVRRTIDLTRPHPGAKVSFTAGQFWT